MKPVFFNGFDPVINNFLASNKLQATNVFFKLILRVSKPKTLNTTQLRIATTDLITLCCREILRDKL